MPVVSIVIPSYNHAHSLGEAVESALGQTYSNVEIVVVDDGSTDHTADVAARYPGVRYVRQDNHGLPAARNTGILRSQGDYLVFLDADDRLLPEAVEAGLQCFQGHPESAFVWGRFRWIDAAGEVLGMPGETRIEGDPYLAMLRRNFVSMHATAMFRRRALEAVGGYSTELRACEDYDIYLRITRRFPAHQHASVVAEYRMHDRNLSGDSLLILTTALQALSKQWTYAKLERPSRKAFEEGVRFWIDTYGRQYVSAVADWRIGGRWREAAQGGILLLKYVPQWFAKQTAMHMSRGIFKRVQWALPAPVRRRLQKRWPFLALPPLPPVGGIRFGDLRRLAPFDRYFGYARGLPVDRHYIEQFLGRHAEDVQGHVLEIKDRSYTLRFGGDRVVQSDVLDIDSSNQLATVVADLTKADHVASESFDCVILTQTLHLIYDLRAALATAYRTLKPGGVLLTTSPGITKVAQEMPWYWMLTEASARRLFEEVFPAEAVAIEAYGNVLAATAFLQGIAVEELRQEELDHYDPDYPVTIAVRAVKPVSSS